MSENFNPHEAKAIAEENRKFYIETFLEAQKKNGSQGKRNIKYFNSIPKTYQVKWIKAYFGELGKAACLKLHCIECSGWSLIEARRCQSTQCSLYNVRPQ